MTDNGWYWVRAMKKRDFLTSYFTRGKNMRGIEGTGWQVANEIVKPQVSINSNNSSIDCSLQSALQKNCNQK